MGELKQRIAHLPSWRFFPDNERVTDLTKVIAAVEPNPPITPNLPALKPQYRKQVEQPMPPNEPTIDIPMKKGTKTVKISHLKLTGGETNAAAYREAVLLAGKLIDDVYALAKKMGFPQNAERYQSAARLADPSAARSRRLSGGCFGIEMRLCRGIHENRSAPVHNREELKGIAHLSEIHLPMPQRCRTLYRVVEVDTAQDPLRVFGDLPDLAR